MACRLCLTETEFCLPLKNAETRDEEAEDIAGVIRKHFDLPLDIDSDFVCTVCWQQISEFHTFYMFIEEKQKELNHQIRLLFTGTGKDATPIATDDEHEIGMKDEVHATPQGATENLDKINEFIDEVNIETPNCEPSATPTDTDSEYEYEVYIIDDDEVNMTNESLIEISSPMRASERAKSAETEHEVVRKDAAANEMHLRNGSIIDTQNISLVLPGMGNIPMVPAKTLNQWNDGENSQKTTENFENMKDVELIDQVDLTNDMSPKNEYKQDAEMRDDDGNDDQVGIKNSSTIKISAPPMITENNLRQCNKVANSQKDTENREDAQIIDLVDSVDDQQSKSVTNVNKISSCVVTGADAPEVKRRKISNTPRNANSIKYTRNNAKDSAILKRQYFENHMQHFEKQHSYRGYVKCCEKKFFCRQNYTDHLEWHLDPNLWKCEPCDCLFTCRISFEVHLSTVHQVSAKLKYKCGDCPAKFSQKYLLHEHVREDHFQICDEFWKCDVCSIEFSSIRQLNSHIKLVHLNHKCPPACDICGKKFASNWTMMYHKTNVHNVQKITCDECSSEFTYISHQKARTKQGHQEARSTNFQCTHCSKKCVLKM